MTNRLWLLTACFLVCLPFAAEAQFPKPRPATTPSTTTAPAPAPTPETVQATSPTVNVAPPNVSVSPQLALPTPSLLDEIKTWLMTLFGGIIAAAFGKIAVTGVKTTTPDAGNTQGGDPLTALVDKAKNPQAKAVLDNLIARATESELVRSGVRTGIGGALGLVPGAGGVLAGSQLPTTIETLINATAKKVVAEMRAAPPVAS